MSDHTKLPSSYVAWLNTKSTLRFEFASAYVRGAVRASAYGVVSRVVGGLTVVRQHHVLSVREMKPACAAPSLSKLSVLGVRDRTGNGLPLVQGGRLRRRRSGRVRDAHLVRAGEQAIERVVAVAVGDVVDATRVS